MAVEIRVPSSGESVVEATVGRWLKREGEAVGPDDVVVELETDKVNVEVASGFSGVIEKILRQTGETVGINDVLATVAEGSAPNSNGASASTAPPQTQSVRVETPVVATSPSVETGADTGGFATPVARKMADEHGLKVAEIRGTGANGKVTIDDVQNHVATLNQVVKAAPAAATVTAPRVETGPTPSESGTRSNGVGQVETGGTTRNDLSTLLLGDNRREVIEPMSRLRLTVAEHLVKSQQTAAMLTTFNEVDLTAVMEIRKRRKDSFKEKYGVNLGFMSFFTKAVIGALKAFPLLNAEIRGTDIIKKQYYDIGIAVGTDKGLVVPVVRNADRLGFAGIEREIGELAGKARNGKLTLPELTGGTFTITNGGVYGSLMSTPILNAPQVGILGMHKIQERPIVVNGEIVIRPMMYLALSYDHRIVDGSEAVRFLVRVKELLEDPENLLLEG